MTYQREPLAATKLQENDKILYLAVAEPESTMVLQSQKNYFLRLPQKISPEEEKRSGRCARHAHDRWRIAYGSMAVDGRRRTDYHDQRKSRSSEPAENRKP